MPGPRLPVPSWFTVTCIALLSACGGGGDSTPVTPGPVAISSLSLSSSAIALTGIGSESSLDVSASPANATTPIVARTDNATIATVSLNGRTAVVRAVGGGTTRVVVTAGSVEASAAITVTPIARTVNITPPAGGTALTVGQSLTLEATTAGDAGAAATVSWSSSAPTIAAITASGVVTALAPGLATISATATSNPSASASLQFTVTPAPAVQSVSLSPALDTVLAGGTRQFAATVTADNGVLRTVTWRSSAPTIASIDATGRATALALGSTTITAISVADTTKRATAQLVVRAPRVTAITVPALAELTVGDTVRAVVSVTGDAGVNQSVTWSSSNPAAATVAPGTGLVTAVSPGSSTITATSVATPTVSGSRSIQIREAPGALTWQTTGLGLPAGSPTTQRLRIWSVNAQLAFAVGDSGTLFRLTPTGSTRLGESGIQRTDLSYEGLRPAIGGSSASEVVMAGPGGRLVRWDGAQMQVLSTGGADFAAVSGYGTGSAIAVGSSGRIMRVRNGAATVENSGTTLALHAVDARSDVLAVAAGNVGSSSTPTVLMHNGSSWNALPPVRPNGIVRGVAVVAANDVYVSLEGSDVDRFASLYRWNGTTWSRVLPLTPLPTELTRCPNGDIVVGSDGKPFRGRSGVFTRLGSGDWDIHPELNTYSCDVDEGVRIGGGRGFSARMTPGAMQIETWALSLSSVSVVSPTRAFMAGEYGALWSWNGLRWALATTTIYTETSTSVMHADGTDVWLARNEPSGACGVFTLHRLRSDGGLDTFAGLSFQPGAATGLYSAGSTYAVVGLTSAAACGGAGLRTTIYNNGTRTDVSVPALLPNSARLAVHGIGTTTVYLAEASGGSGQLLRLVSGAWQPVGARVNFEPTSVWVGGASLVYAVGSNGGVLHYDGTTVRTLSTGLPALTGTNLVGVWGTAPNDVHVCGANGAVGRFDGVRWVLESPPAALGTASIAACSGASGIGIQAGTKASVRMGVGAAAIHRLR